MGNSIDDKNAKRKALLEKAGAFTGETEAISTLPDPLEQKAKPQTIYTPVKIRTDTVVKFKKIVFENDLESHGKIMNTVLENWANEILNGS